MATATKTAPRTARKSAKDATKPMDAVRLLKADHREVEGFFADYAGLDDAEEKQALADRICLALTVHTTLEEEIFYPATREQIEDDDLMDEAQVEHASAKQLIAEIQEMQAGDALFDAKVKVLGEYVRHHVQEEEKEMFPEARDAKLDLTALGEQLAARKAELMASAKPKR
jgi:hemerythrin superfamily protein